MREYLLVGTYTTDDAPGCTEDTVCGSGVYCYAYDSDTGQIGDMTDMLKMENPSYLAANREGNLLFAVSETMKASEVCLCSLEVGKLAMKDCLSVSGAAACHVAYDETWGLLAVSNYMSGSIVIASLRNQERLVRRLQIWYQGRGSNLKRQEISHVHSSLFYKNYLLAADLGLDQIHVYRIVDGETELLEDIAVRAGSGPRHMAVYQEGDNTWLYVVNELSCDVSVYRFRAGGFQEIQNVSLCDGLAGEENMAADIHITKNGILYASIRGDDRIIWFRIQSGTLTRLGSMKSGGEGPRSFCFDREERHLIVANQLSSCVSVYPMEDGIVKEETLMTFPVPIPVKVLVVSDRP